MHHIVKNRVLPVVAGAVIVVAGLNAASYAANGRPLTLGAQNKETRTATLTNTGQGSAYRRKVAHTWHSPSQERGHTSMSRRHRYMCTLGSLLLVAATIVAVAPTLDAMG